MPKSTLKQCPYRENDYITRQDAQDYLAPIVYPDFDEKVADKKVYDALRYAESEEVLHFSRGRSAAKDKINAEDLFTWAVTKKAWKRLYRVPGLPFRKESGEASVSFGLSIAAGGGPIPENRQEIEQELLKEREKRLKLQIKYDELQRDYEESQHEISNLLEDIETLKVKRAQTSKKLSEAAKKPRPRK